MLYETQENVTKITIKLCPKTSQLNPLLVGNKLRATQCHVAREDTRNEKTCLQNLFPWQSRDRMPKQFLKL
jgi:hypothetical protein